MDSENIQSGFSEQRKGENIEYIPITNDEKVEVFIREVVRVKIGDLCSVKHSFEEWAKRWD